MRSDIPLDGAAGTVVTLLFWLIVVLATTAMVAYAAALGLDTPIVRRIYDVGLAVFTFSVVGVASTAYLVFRMLRSRDQPLDR